MKYLRVIIFCLFTISLITVSGGSDDSYIPSSSSSLLESNDKDITDSEKSKISKKRVRPEEEGKDEDGDYSPNNNKVRKRKRIYYHPIGSQTMEARFHRTLVNQLRKKNNGVFTYEKAKEKTKDIFEKKRLQRNEKDRAKYKISPRKKMYLKPGYQGVEQTIKRNIKTFMKKDKSLSKEEAEIKATNHVRAQNKRKSEYQRLKRQKKRLE